MIFSTLAINVIYEKYFINYEMWKHPQVKGKEVLELGGDVHLGKQSG